MTPSAPSSSAIASATTGAVRARSGGASTREPMRSSSSSCSSNLTLSVSGRTRRSLRKIHLRTPRGGGAYQDDRAYPGSMPVPLMDLAPMRAHLRERLLAAAADVLDSGRFILGPEVKAFEHEAAVYVDAAHGVGVANGTDALVLALRALGVGPGDEVICPAYTFFATPEAIAAAGATPVFADIE